MNPETQDSSRSGLADLIDDATYGRFDKRKSSLFFGQYIGEDKKSEAAKKARQNVIEAIRQNKPGYQLKDVALRFAARSILFQDGKDDPECPGPNRAGVGIRSWTRKSDILWTPQKIGVPKYAGDPAEAAKIVKRTAKTFGACRVGITGLDRRHVYKTDCDGKEIAFEPVEEPYETEDKRVIPEKCKYAVVMLVQMPPEAFACAPFPIGSMVPSLSYKRIELLIGAVAEFIRGLGYIAIPSSNDTATNGPFALEAGLGEQCRMDKIINPDFGPMIRICKVFTDLPMQLDKRQSSGIADFCKVCRRCVEACPVNTINDAEEPSFEVPGAWVNPGHKTWHGDNVKCWAYANSMGSTCGICLNVCPWNKPKGLLHTAVKAIIKRTSLFNRFFVFADKLFGYGKAMDPERWWELDPPAYGIDNRR